MKLHIISIVIAVVALIISGLALLKKNTLQTKNQSYVSNGIIPNQIIFILDATCPANYTEFNDANDHFLLVDNTAPSTIKQIEKGGDKEHRHFITKQTLKDKEKADWQGGGSPDSTLTTKHHTHEFNVKNSSNLPPYIKVKACISK